jgi:RimJ/RimL family protein N-acetyltransferase
VTVPRAGPRLLLRAFTPADAPAAHRLIYGDPEVMRHVGTGPLADLTATRELLAAYAAHHADHGFGFWAVEERATGALVGDAGLERTLRGEVELGYTLARGAWGRGYATEAGELCVAAARELGLGELVGVVDVGNPGSVRVLEKLGFRPAGERIAYGRPHRVLRRAV